MGNSDDDACCNILIDCEKNSVGIASANLFRYTICAVRSTHLGGDVAIIFALLSEHNLHCSLGGTLDFARFHEHTFSDIDAFAFLKYNTVTEKGTVGGYDFSL